MKNTNLPLKELITLAQGKRSIEEYSIQCGVSVSMINKIKYGYRNPGKNTLIKLSSKAENGITYTILYNASKYSTNYEIGDNLDSISCENRIEIYIDGTSKIYRATKSQIIAILHLLESFPKDS